MELHPDFRELLESFVSAGVEFVVVGAYALAVHGAPRYTGDLDLFVQASEENGRRILRALAQFGFGSLEVQASDFAGSDLVVQLGVAPVRVDLLTGLTGLTWEEARSGARLVELGGLEVPVLGLPELIRNKKSLGRHQDLADLEALGEDPDAEPVGDAG